MKKITLISLGLCVAVLTGLACKQQIGIYMTDKDRAIFDKYLTEMKSKKSLPMGQLITESALFFLGTPYVASTLEKEPEGLVVNLREMDCATFVDNVIALSRTIKGDNPSFENFCLNLRQLRYQEGIVSDYLSRLHYTSDWVYVNDKRKIVRDINKEIGGIPLTFDLSFMSTYPDSYRQLKGNPPLVERIAQKEKEISARTTYHFIPRDKIEAYADKMQSGDMVCFTTAVKGLDTSHVGFIYWEGDRLTFIHASSLQQKVVVESTTLKEYVQKGKNSTGIMLARPL
ncbi:MAG: DUF1460 domain-containing protein [Tannerellaceae bacterium]|jgi:hypothetical protein|nr:DUF1460 domain-containing protein [Tannerellaceae bacterium]